MSGRSVHNQRIERLWRDVFEGCLLSYYSLFQYREELSVLDIDNDIHLFSLHFVYLPRINNSLRTFQSAWNNHPLSSVSHNSPNQLWISASLPDDAEVINFFSFCHQTIN